MTSNSPVLIRAIRGPVMLITLGLLFVADYFGPYPFYKTWPVLLIVFGLMKLFERTAVRDGDTAQGMHSGGTT